MNLLSSLFVVLECGDWRIHVLLVGDTFGGDRVRSTIELRLQKLCNSVYDRLGSKAMRTRTMAAIRGVHTFWMIASFAIIIVITIIIVSYFEWSASLGSCALSLSSKHTWSVALADEWVRCWETESFYFSQVWENFKLVCRMRGESNGRRLSLNCWKATKLSVQFQIPCAAPLPQHNAFWSRT